MSESDHQRFKSTETTDPQQVRLVSTRLCSDSYASRRRRAFAIEIAFAVAAPRCACGVNTRLGSPLPHRPWDQWFQRFCNRETGAGGAVVLFVQSRIVATQAAGSHFALGVRVAQNYDIYR